MTTRRYLNSGAIRVCALLAMMGLTLPVAAQPALQSGSDRDARIDALEADLKRIEAELKALRQEPRPQDGATSTHSSTMPSSAATASGGQALPAADPGDAKSSSPRIFGPGIPTTAAVASIDSGHPVIATPDGRFTANILAVAQFDIAGYLQPTAGPLGIDLRRGGSAADTAHARDLANGSIFRRARFGIGGRAFGDFEYTALFEFGGSGNEDSGHVQELWLQYSGLRPLHIRAGAFAPFIGLEDAGSTNGMLFLERPASADIARSLAGGDYREAGQLTVNTERWFASAAITGRQINTVGSSASPVYDSQQGFIGRLAALPYRDGSSLVHVGAHASYVGHATDTGGPDAAPGAATSVIQFRERPELRVDGTRLIDTGAISAAHAYSVGAEFAVQRRNLMVQAEYDRLGIERHASPLSDPAFDGFYVEGSWIVTGETRRYNTGNFAFDGPKVTPFDPSAGQWGAWELALRYSDMNLNYHAGSPSTAPAADAVRGGDQRILTAGVNWYLNSIMRLMLDYQYVRIRRLSPNASTFLTPVGADIGQNYSAVAGRVQWAF